MDKSILQPLSGESEGSEFMEQPQKSLWAAEVFAVLGGIFLWEITSRLLNSPSFPPFSAVLNALWEIYKSGVLLEELAASLKSLLVGYSLAVVFGFALGSLMARFEKVGYFFEPLIQINISTPSIIYIPILFSIFGISDATRYAIVFMYSFFIIVVNTEAGLLLTNPLLQDMAVSFGATESQLFRRVKLPEAMPLILAGIRLGMTRAVKGMINGELFIVLVGLGARLRYYTIRFQMDKVLAILLVIIIVAIVATSIVQVANRRITSWADTVQK